MQYIVDSLADKEVLFSKNLTDSSGKRFTTTTAIYPNAIAITTKKPNWFYPEKNKKTKIVLHFTVGNLLSDIAALTKGYVSVAYIVARSGQVYELFNPDYWSYHLGPTAVGGNGIQGKQSIGIEISNYGPLVLSGDSLNTIYKTSYCSKDSTEYVVSSHRGYNYYCKFTDAQYESISSLLEFLTNRYGIPYTIPSSDQQLSYISSVPGSGIWSHQNFRKDKTDVGPAFDWNRIKGNGKTS